MVWWACPAVEEQGSFEGFCREANLPDLLPGCFTSFTSFRLLCVHQLGHCWADGHKCCGEVCCGLWWVTLETIGVPLLGRTSLVQVELPRGR